MRILVVKLSSLGDLFHALPAVRMLKERFSATIDWVATDLYCDLVRCFADVDRAIPFYRRAFLPKLVPFLRDLRRERYDMIVDFQGLLKSAVVARLARGGERIGPPFHREGARLLYSRIAGPRHGHRHAVEQNLDMARALGARRSEPVFRLRLPERAVDGPRPRVALLPVSRWRTKNWPAAHWGRLAALLHGGGAGSMYLLGSREDGAVCGEIERLAAVPVANLAGRMSLVETCAFLREMDLLIANDSGPVHMAAAVGTRCLVLFGPTDPARTGPYGEEHRVLRTASDCMPCLSRTCKTGTYACLMNLLPDKVACAAFDMMRGMSIRQGSPRVDARSFRRCPEAIGPDPAGDGSLAR